ncbi:hypothetical protein BO86DRAFT_210671 [Aspergillus japonicus CBS 114.51]|uniref:Uncharacterized protein n=1 Tax=Aspergillus japonicus CBS 114.51 TaxID=1448312 RepID=A0A8T8XA75_ASPJA|nr:hypothetical protein BO86DRAFT_210671 [Aspergillus japonicus CBS 114.51]RAH84971.1 hypothetical protein BO86DRAFT_210671 [Aspergillus japonicus CBS 114.51]
MSRGKDRTGADAYHRRSNTGYQSDVISYLPFWQGIPPSNVTSPSLKISLVPKSRRFIFFFLSSSLLLDFLHLSCFFPLPFSTFLSFLLLKTITQTHSLPTLQLSTQMGYREEPLFKEGYATDVLTAEESTVQAPPGDNELHRALKARHITMIGAAPFSPAAHAIPL